MSTVKDGWIEEEEKDPAMWRSERSELQQREQIVQKPMAGVGLKCCWRARAQGKEEGRADEFIASSQVMEFGEPWKELWISLLKSGLQEVAWVEKNRRW